ncbi:tetratricopeptide repeat protein [Egbenema bharatensis]|uniref:tetratricopeptide repeat protein n=1 Tax=Egbenema bharatensis TaxID=3463334 RepID=UPI003A83FE02
MDKQVLGANDAPHDDGNSYLRGMAQLKSGSPDDAIVSFDRALEGGNSDGLYRLYQVWYGKGEALAQLERYEDAIACYQQALNEYSNDPEIWTSYGKALGALARYREAITSYETGLTLQRQAGDRQGEARTLMALNMLYPLDGRMRESAEAFQQMTEILNQLEIQSDDPYRMSIMGGVALPNQQLHFLMHWIRQLNRSSIQVQVRSILLRISWFMFFGFSLALILISTLWWSKRRTSSQSSPA